MQRAGHAGNGTPSLRRFGCSKGGKGGRRLRHSVGFRRLPTIARPAGAATSEPSGSRFLAATCFQHLAPAAAGPALTGGGLGRSLERTRTSPSVSNGATGISGAIIAATVMEARCCGMTQLGGTPPAALAPSLAASMSCNSIRLRLPPPSVSPLQARGSATGGRASAAGAEPLSLALSRN